MEDERIDLGVVDSVVAEDIGEPGQRTFRVTPAGPRGEAVIWMEKEQLFQIGLAIKQFIARIAPVEDPRPFEPERPAPLVPDSAEFKAADIRIRHDRESDVFTIEAADSESEAEDDDEEPEIVLQFSFRRQMAEELAEQALKVVAAGRPRCPLCGGPIDPDGHICPKSNGHHTGRFELA